MKRRTAAVGETSQRTVDGESWRGGLWIGSLAGIRPFGDTRAHREDCHPRARSGRLAKSFTGGDRKTDQCARVSRLSRSRRPLSGLRLFARNKSRLSDWGSAFSFFFIVGQRIRKDFVDPRGAN